MTYRIDRQLALLVLLGLWATSAWAAELTVCTCISSAEAGGELLDGFELDLLGEYVARHGLELHAKPLQSPCVARIEGLLEEGACEVGAVNLTYTPERARRMALTAGYFPVRAVLVERKGRVTRSVEELAGRTFATPRGLTSEALIRKIPGARIVYVESPAEAFKAVAAGRVDATVYDSALVLDQLATYPELEVGLPLSGVDHYAFAVRPGSPLLASLNAFLADIKRSGEYGRLLEARFGHETAQLVLEMLEVAEGGSQRR